MLRFRLDPGVAAAEFGMLCQRLVPWAGGGEDPEPPAGLMACFLAAGGRSAPDCHDQDEVVVVLSGAGVITVGDDTAPLAAGDVVVIPRNCEHTVASEQQAELAWLSLYWPLHERGGRQ